MGFGLAMAHGMPYAQQRMSPVRIHIFINLVHDANGKPHAQLPGMLLSVCCYRYVAIGLLVAYLLVKVFLQRWSS